MKERIASHVASVHNVLMLAGLVAVGLTGSMGTLPAPASDTLAQRVQSGKGDRASPQPRSPGRFPQARPSPFNFKVDNYYDQLRQKLTWLPCAMPATSCKTPDPQSRLLLARPPRKRAGLDEVGLSYRDVYGIINAETSWIPRLGASKDGTPNLGIAQFEPATAKAVGLTDPTDPVQAVHAMAVHLKDAAVWSAKRIACLNLTPEQHARKLREGVSIYYNLSSKGRSVWDGTNTAKLPVETRRHIANARVGAREAGELEDQLREVRARVGQPGMMTASFQRSSGG
jgi:hypothetical protein